MTKEEIEKVEEYFTCYHEGKHVNIYGINENELCKSLSHKEHDFHIIIFPELNEVYQLNTDHEIFGIELETFEKLTVRFESFTGDKIDNIETIQTHD